MNDIPPMARAYVGATIGLGGLAMWSAMPPTFVEPVLFLVLLAAAVAGSTFKVRLPLSRGGLTLSVSFVPIFMAVLMLDRGAALIVAALSAWTQCTFKPQENYPVYRAVFSVSVMVLAADAAGRVYASLGGAPGLTPALELVPGVLAAGATFFVVNSVLVSLAVSAASGLSFRLVWLDGLLWAAAAYVVEAGAAAVMAVLVVNIGLLAAPFIAAPVWLNYRVFRYRIAAMAAANTLA